MPDLLFTQPVLVHSLIRAWMKSSFFLVMLVAQFKFT